MNSRKSSPRFRFVGSSALLVLLALLLPALRDGDRRLYLLAAGVTAATLLGMIIAARLFSLDRFILSVALYLGAVGIISLAPSDPDAALMQLLRVSGGAAVLIAGAMAIRILSSSMLTAGITSFLGLLLLTGSLLSRDVPLPFAETALILLILSSACLLTCRGGTAVLFPGIAGTFLLLLQGLPAEAAVLALSLVLLLWSSDGRSWIVLIALASQSALFFGAYRLGYLPVPPSAEQQAASLSSLVSAGLVGSDVISFPQDPALPVSPILFSLTQHFGLIFTGLTLLLYLPLTLRGASIACTARSRFHAVLSMGCVLVFSLRIPAALLSTFGTLPMIPVRLPLLTDSLPDLAAQMLSLGLLCGISSVNEADLAEDAHLARLAR